MAATESDHSLSALVSTLTRQVSTLVHQEVALAQAEVRQNMTLLGRNLTLVIVGGLIGYTGLLGVLGTAIVLLAQVLPWWQATLAVGGGLTVLGAIVLFVGQFKLRRTSLIPAKTMRAIMTTTQEVMP